MVRTQLKKYLSLKGFWGFLKGLYENRKIIYQLVEKDMQNQYLGSFLGVTWSFIQPTIFILVLWFVFSTGLRGARTAGEVPFVLYLVAGIIIWNFFSACLPAGASSIKQNSYLVNKMVFRVSMLPVVKILSSLVVHTFFLVVVMILYFAHGYFIDLYYLQILYYIFATMVFTLGVSWITSSVALFFPDLFQIIQLVVRIGFWFTPIIWPIERVPEKYQVFVKANPAYYLVMGYRDSLIYKVWFWEHPALTTYFWLLTLIVFALGSIVFRRLKPHFADVL
ncbi:MAG: ABC transporter permease [Candidatus Aminicenantes bacterium]|nr:ABC transporter permease [Candidatus Aminicenantes bacterium]